MARRRRRNQTRTTRRKRGAITFKVKSSVLREIYAVFYLGLGAITFLSLRNNFGDAGAMWVSVLKPILGWGTYALPVFLIGASLMLFLSKKIVFPFSRLVGIFLLMVSSLSILHLSVPMNDLYTMAQGGNYGGYVGFVTNFLVREIIGINAIGASAIFITLLIVSILLTFEVSIVNFVSFLKPDLHFIRQRNSGKYEDEEEDEDEDLLKNMPEELLRKVEALVDDDFKKPADHNPAEMITIKRAQISPTVPIATTATIERIIPIKNEEREALTSKEGDEDVFSNWAPPSMDLLNPAAISEGESDDALLKDNAQKISEKLSQFGIDVGMHEVHVGPTVIQYTLRPHEGIKLSKIVALKNDLALALAAKAIRIEAPIPGKSLVGIEVPNDHRTLVHLREILETKEFNEIQSNLRLPLGRDVSGKPMCGDLAAMPHLLVAGATGSGKSVGMNTFLISLLYQNSPNDLKLIMIDPKRVEMGSYNGIPHLLTPVITDPGKAAIALRWAVAEMNRRYQLCAENKHRNITEFNTCVDVHEEGRESVGHQKMPNIVIVIDELADLMMAAGKEVEASICRIAQMARAVGIHLIVATQRPSVDVITGLIKANIPARIAFAVSSSIDSRTILDGIGAEDLLGKGDMLYLPGGMSKPVRIQGIYVSTKEIERVTNNIKLVSPAPDYLEEIISTKVAQEKVQGIPESTLADSDDEEMYQQALQVVIESRKASASLLQRRLKLGYARAARLLDMMEQNGAIGPVNGAKAREIYIN
ncbi:MAG: DNA translocase FtsK 4TM domain-containing protein [Candidatus Gracilibacteria bacterium]|jgi:S-DNA-T family DNA segregation ATPase FtsK/SpoIIIE